VVVFQQAAESLRQQLEQLQRQLASPEAASPSFVKKQRQELTAAECRASQLQESNANLMQQLQALREQLAAADGQEHGHEAGGVMEQQPKDSSHTGATAIADAECKAGPSMTAAAVQSSFDLDWNLQELQCLQQENRLLQHKVARHVERHLTYTAVTSVTPDAMQICLLQL
jgi:chromosome segregation ATPase